MIEEWSTEWCQSKLCLPFDQEGQCFDLCCGNKVEFGGNGGK